MAFQSEANNLLIDENDYGPGVFVHDRVTDQTECVSIASDGTLANRGSFYPSISANGRYVAFSSEGYNLVPEDTSPLNDVFVHDRVNGTTEIISIAPDGTPANGESNLPSISSDAGRYVAFSSEATNLVSGTTMWTSIFVKNLDSGVIQKVSVSSIGTEGNHWSGFPSISGDGSMIAFESQADNLVPGDNNNESDVFVHNTNTKVTIRVSVNSFGTEANGSSIREPSISIRRSICRFSDPSAFNLVNGDTNNNADIFIHDSTDRRYKSEFRLPATGPRAMVYSV